MIKALAPINALFSYYDVINFLRISPYLLEINKLVVHKVIVK